MLHGRKREGLTQLVSYQKRADLRVAQLSGAGIGVDWRFASQGLATFAIATPMGSNPGRDVNGLNVDGGRNGTRAWVSINLQF